ncbi:MAG: terpene cyclase/mutase family protein [Isosphaeraceae bacterium]|nr:terpene cyclase/mutase family protein [Isosphaeraceae bacterium]
MDHPLARREGAAILLLLAALLGGQGGVLGSARAEDQPAPNTPEEPLAAALSFERAAAFLDAVAVTWTRQRRCGTCHTNYPYLVARPVLGGTALGGLEEVRRFFEDRVAHWEDDDPKAKPRWDTEVVATAATLAMNDAATTGRLHPLTRKALDKMWTLQRPDGSWDWLKCDWPPFEQDDYFGAVYAALGVGLAPEGYRDTEAARRGLERLRGYFAAHPAPSLHHKAYLFWASLHLDGLMRPAEREATIQDLLALQRPDGGWNLPSLGDWSRRDGSPNDKNAPSDGYATGLVIYILRQAGLPSDREPIQRGAAWLRSHQRRSGRWFTRSLNHDEAHYITHARTAFAVLALKACEAGGARP